ncbi:MAG: beta-N-acetylhexosaminidase [Nitrospinota bacterium]
MSDKQHIPYSTTLEDLSIEDKIGQMLMVGFEGISLSEGIAELIIKYRIGGVILFSHNIETPGQINMLCHQLQECARSAGHKAPLFISVDQEGGRVSRLKPPFPQFPGSGELGAKGSEELVESNARAIGKELQRIGINLNFAPVLDVNTNPQNPVIGDRAFGADPDIVSCLGVAAIKGFQKSGIIPAGKHFPGHGDTSADSHKELPMVDHGLDRIRKVELRPFSAAIESGLSAIMTAHVVYSGIDPDYPATLSKRILQGIMREDMGYQGVIITDDLKMNAIADNYNFRDVVVLAVNAGADILLVCHDREGGVRGYKELMDGVEKGSISVEKVDDSVERILKLKKSIVNPGCF